MWFIKLCLYIITANVCRITDNHSVKLLISIAFLFESIKDIFKGD